MNFFPFFQAVLYTVSTALLYPVVILLTVLSAWMLLYTGGFLAEWVKRRHMRAARPLSESLGRIHQDGKLPSDLEAGLPINIIGYARELEKIVKDEDPFLEEKVEDFHQRKEQDIYKEVDKIRMIVRIGPSLGLMGTLIPMGTGLAGLTQGNMAQLSSSLILAFTTTVIGLALGITAHFYAVIRERWAAEDQRHMSLITEALVRE